MGFIKDIFNPSQGAGFTGSNTRIEQPFNAQEARENYANTQYDQQQQQQFLNALQGQNGIQNQSSVFQQQQGLANQLGLQAAGQGPNPALSQLHQTTAQNIANQGAMMAGQRGASSNAGLMARQAAQQGGALQQQAVGQAATMGAQQQLAAQQALMQQQAMMGQTAGQQVGQQGQATMGLNQIGLQGQQNLYGMLQGQNAANVQMQSNMNNANAGIAQGNQKFQQGMLGSVGNLLGMAHGGVVHGYADGGMTKDYSGAQSYIGQFMSGSSGQQDQSFKAGNDFGAGIKKGFGKAFGSSGAGIDTAAAPVESAGIGEVIGEAAPLALAASTGGKVGGQAMAKGDSSKNDNVPAMLSPGEIVIPRSVLQSEDPVGGSAKFVQAILARHNMSQKK